MIIGIGVDLTPIDRFASMVERRPGLAQRLLTPGERAVSVESQAARFAAKEALAKALGSPGGMRWLDAEVVSSVVGQPGFVLSGTVAELAERLGVRQIHLSLSHDAGAAIAMVVCES